MTDYTNLYLFPCWQEKGEQLLKTRKTLSKLLNYSFLNYTNKTRSCGEKDLPALYCKTEVYPDYLALYSEPSLYHKIDRTGVCFYQFDSVFDGKRGLYEAIYHDDTARLAYFKKRFEGVKFFYITRLFRIWRYSCYWEWIQAIQIPCCCDMVYRRDRRSGDTQCFFPHWKKCSIRSGRIWRLLSRSHKYQVTFTE